VIDLSESRVRHPSQIIKLLDFKISTRKLSLQDTLKATLAVLGLHLVRYLKGDGHPSGCEDMFNALPPMIQNELSRIEPAVLRANLLLRAMSDFESIPMESSFALTVSLT
jgi:hypothetical protein